MEYFFPADLRGALEHGGRVSRIKADQPWRARRESKPAHHTAARPWRRPDSAGRQSLLRSDTGIVFDWRGDSSQATAAAALSALYNRSTLPQQCGPFYLPLFSEPLGAAVLHRRESHSRLHIL